jgi:hypothetical protein
MKKNTFVVLGMILLLTAFAGCATTNNGSSSGYPQQPSMGMSNTMKFDDVPVPAGFRIINNESFAFQNDRMRVGLLKYAGSPDANGVVAFYKEQMPMYNWDLINVIEYGERIMNFERADQTCIITIRPLSTRTVIAIAVAPKSGTNMTEEKVQKFKELKEQYIPPTKGKSK